MNNFWSNIALWKQLYRLCFDNVLKKYNLTKTEFDIIMFLYNNANTVRATDITEHTNIAKSNVSAAVKSLSARGYVKGYRPKNNRRTVMLKLIAENCTDIFIDINESRTKFNEIIFDGFSKDELNLISEFFNRLTNNIKNNITEEHNVRTEEH